MEGYISNPLDRPRNKEDVVISGAELRKQETVRILQRLEQELGGGGKWGEPHRPPPRGIPEVEDQGQGGIHADLRIPV